MTTKLRRLSTTFPAFLPFLSLGALLAAAAALVNCGNSTVTFRSNPPTGTLSVSLSDPPSCRVPAGSFQHIYISVRSVQAHLSATASDTSAGWQELASNLVTQPIQIDLLATSQNSCVLAQLGRNTSLPVGDYQQIRLLLVSNQPGAGEPVPPSNACGSHGFNCAVLSDGSIHELMLSSQANTGLKIPPGQILGGPIRVQSGQHADLNIDFNACASIVMQVSGEMRLRPALTAGQVSLSLSGLSGQIVDQATMLPIAGGKVVVAVEQADSAGVDRTVMEATADANGNFNFCPLPSGMYDVVAVAINGSGVAYNATTVLNVPSGATLGKIPLLPEGGSGTAAGPATIQGTVTAASGTSGANVDVALSALQTLSLAGGATRTITLPVQGNATPNVATASATTCPANTNCASYALVVPASNPSFGIFATSGTSLSTPATGDVLYTIEARAFQPMSGGTPICSPSRLTTDKDSADQPLKVTGGATVTAKRMDFAGCSP